MIPIDFKCIIDSDHLIILVPCSDLLFQRKFCYRNGNKIAIDLDIFC